MVRAIRLEGTCARTLMHRQAAGSLLMMSIVGAQEQVEHATSSSDSDDEEADQVLQAERRK